MQHAASRLHSLCYMRSEGLAAVKILRLVLCCNAMPCGLIRRYHGFEESRYKGNLIFVIYNAAISRITDLTLH